MSESLEQRKKRMLDEMMSVGAAGFSGAAPAEGPNAGYDPVMGSKTPLDRALKGLKKKRKKKS